MTKVFLGEGCFGKIFFLPWGTSSCMDRVAVQRPKQAVGTGQQEGFKIQQQMPSPAPGKKTPCNDIDWGLSGWGAALPKKTWGSWQSAS